MNIEDMRQSAESVIDSQYDGCTCEGYVVQAGRVLALVDALEKIKDRTEFWCPECGWTGAERELELQGANTEAGNDEMAYCPKCGSDEVGEFEPDEYAKEAIERAAKI